RYAIYFAPPPGSALEAFGRLWLGRDHITGMPVEPPEIQGLAPADLRRITRSAQHYGFHATLKAPFALKDGRTADELHQAADGFARARKACDAPPLRLSRLSRWIALMLSQPCSEVDRLAADCVRDFELFRAPATEDDISRRRQNGLTPRQDEQLLTYGYPHIFDDFQFHMTLAGPLEAEDRQEIFEILRHRTSLLETAPLAVDAIAIYEQPNRDRPFTQTARFPFSAP
ncbi:MAG: DUF1045 domain-containing protein, partial [Geminicoccaceae bacterium]